MEKSDDEAETLLTEGMEKLTQWVAKVATEEGGSPFESVTHKSARMKTQFTRDVELSKARLMRGYAGILEELEGK
jgi:hypothetical protein